MKQLYLLIITLFLYCSATAQVNADFSSDVTSGCNPLQVTFQSLSQNASNYVWDFGDGNTSTLRDPSHLYTNPGSYDVSLIASNGSISDTIIKRKFIQVGLIPTANVQVLNSNTCINSSVNFINSGDSSFTYNWIFGDGNSSNSYHANHAYTTAGTYQVSLQIISNTGCVNLQTLNQTVQVIAPDTIDFYTDSTVQCNTGTVSNFYMNSSSPNHFIWDFGDGNMDSINANPMHVYLQEGKYTVSLITHSANGCKSEIIKTDYITVAKPQAVQISLSDSVTCQNDSIVLSGDSTFVHFQWVFEDGSKQIGNFLKTEFINSGKQVVNLVATDSLGCKIGAVSDSIDVLASPIAAFNFTPDTVCPPYLFSPLNMSFNANEFSWIVGADTHFTQTPNVTLTEKGIYDIGLIAKNGICQDKLVYKNGLKLDGGKTKVLLDDSLGCAPHKVQMTLKDTSYKSITWLTGNGDTLFGPKIDYTYLYGGMFSPTVFLESYSGCYDTLQLDYAIEVIDENSVFSTPDTLFLCQPGSVQFDGFSIGGGFWKWDFGTGDTSITPNPSYYFASPGVYTVKLHTQNTEGCYYRLEPYNIVVVKDPTARFSVDVKSCPFYQVDFTPLDSGNISWLWDFGNGFTDTSKSPTHYYGGPGYYNASLITWDANGCMSKSTMINGVAVQQCIGDGTVDGGMPGGASGGGGAFSDTLSPIVACLPYTLELKMPVDSVLSQTWLFGNGQSSVLPNPSYTFTKRGNFTITLIVETAPSVFDTIVNQNFVQLSAPVADFVYSRNNYCDSSEVQFINQSSFATSYTWNLGSKGYSAQQEPKITFSESNEMIRLTAKDNYGCKSTMAKNISFGAPNPYFDFEEFVCLGDSVFFSSNVEDYFKYRWEIGSGKFLEGENPSMRARDTGTFIVRLHVTDSLNCIKTIVSPKTLTISNPIANFSFNDATKHCNVYTVDVVNNSTGAEGYWWDFGNGDSLSTKLPDYRYTNEGEYFITLTAFKDGCETKQTNSQKVIINKVKVDFASSQNTNCLPVTVNFTDLSDNAVNWFWAFGDGDTSSVPNPVHTYVSKPTALVGLTIIDSNGCEGSVLKQGVKLHQANPIADRWEGCSPLTIQFNDSTSNVKSYAWNFGDGTSSSIKAPQHTYNVPGSYTVSLITQSIEGCYDTLVLKDAVHVGDVGAQFSTLDSVNACAPYLVEFTNESYGATKYTWHFGDGKQSNEKNPIHVYTKPGIFDVMLIADNQYSCLDTFIMKNRFNINSPEIDFSISDSVFCGPSEITLVDNSQRVRSRKWFFGDGAIGTNQTEVYKYQNEGIYQVSLMVTDTAGCVEHKTKQINILKKPEVGFSLDSVYGCAPLSITFRNNTTNTSPGVSYNWVLGNRNFPSLGDTAFNFTNSGAYTIGLIAENENGCIDRKIFGDSLKIYGQSQPIEPKIYTVSVENNSSIDLSWEESEAFEFKKYVLYKEEAQGNYNEFLSFYNKNEIDYSISFQGKHQVNRFKIATENYCVASVNQDNLDHYESIDLSLSANATGIELTWNSYKTAGFDAYKIYRKQSALSKFNLIAELGVEDSIYMDTSILCNELYSYKVVAENIYNLGYQANSDIEEIKPIVNIFATQNILPSRATVVKNETVLLEWRLPKLNEFIVKGIELNRNKNLRGGMKRIDYLPATSTSYMDYDVSVSNQSYNYQLILDHTCLSKENDNAQLKSMWLTINTDGSINYLRWTPAIGLEGGVKEYLIQKKDQNGNWETIKRVDSQELDAVIDMYED